MTAEGMALARLGEELTRRAEAMLISMDAMAEAHGHSVDAVLAPLSA